MNSTAETLKNTPAAPLPDWERTIIVIGHKRRWKILKELSAGEPRTISEIATAAGCGYDNAAQHLKLMRDAGLIEQKFGRLYNIPKQYGSMYLTQTRPPRRHCGWFG